MEMECMEAESKGLELELWRLSEEEASAGSSVRFGQRALSCLKITSLAMVIVLAAVIPLATERETGLADFAAPAGTVSLLTSTEKDIIDALRQSLSNANRGRILMTVEIPEPAAPNPSERGAAAAAERPASAPAVRAVAKVDDPGPPAPEVSAPPEVAAQVRPSADEVISLIQVGQRALRVSEPAITIMP
jgi:hypothetical protein